MTLAITTDQEQLVEAVTQFAARHAPIDKTRAAFGSIAAGDLPPWWDELTGNGFHAVHLPESLGGQGGTLADLACVIEAAAAALLPGPLLSTVTASAVADLADADAVVSDFARGDTGALVLPEDSGIRAERRDGGWRLDGATVSILGICSARHIVLAASADDDTVGWFVIDTQREQVTVDRQQGTDLCTDLGVLRLDDHIVDADSELRGLSVERVRCVAVALAACASAGAARRCAEAATDYIRTREQFGQPVGAFQGLQHKAAVLRVNTELAAAAAWDAVHAATESLDQQRLAAGSAALMAVAAAPDLMLDAMLMFGAIGYTWEHDTHLYWRRVTSLAASFGPTTRWSRDVGDLSRTVKRASTLDLGDVESDFRASVAGILDRASALPNEHPSDDDRAPGLATGTQRDMLAEAGMVAPQLPPPWGIGATAVQQVIINEEFSRRPNLVKPSLGIAEWILPTILSDGTDVQRERFAEPILRGTQRWCQLFSEPGAGSDLASLSTRARKVDEGWIINGHKVWTSLAHQADFGALLARTDPDAAKHRGLSYFLIDMASPGITIEPITLASGHPHFNEVFLNDVFVPDDALVGAPGSGWNHAIGTMAVERTAIGNYVTIDRTAALRHVAGIPGPDQDTALQALGEVEAFATAIKAMVVRETLRLVEGQAAGPASSIAKYAMVMLLRRAATATLGLTGRLAMSETSDPEVIRPYFDMPSELIGGGTSEIQLNIIASMILGLPKG